MGSSGARAKELFLEALSRDAAERQEFLAVACGADAALLQNVESLLAAHDAAEQKDAELPASDGDEPFAPGDTFAGRGSALNDTFASLPSLLGYLRPVTQYLADPNTELVRFFNSLERVMGAVAPVAH